MRQSVFGHCLSPHAALCSLTIGRGHTTGDGEGEGGAEVREVELREGGEEHAHADFLPGIVRQSKLPLSVTPVMILTQSAGISGTEGGVKDQD